MRQVYAMMQKETMRSAYFADKGSLCEFSLNVTFIVAIKPDQAHIVSDTDTFNAFQ